MGDASHVDDRELDEVLDEVEAAFSFSVVAQIAGHHGAVSGIAVGPDHNKLMVTNHADNSVTSIDTDTCTSTRTVIGIHEPFAIAIAGARAYISAASAAYDSIVVVDVTTDRVVGVHPVAYSVRDLAVSSDGMHVYACRTAVHGADIAVVDNMTGHVDAIGLAAGATTGCVRVTPDGARLYVAADGPSGAELAVIDTHQQRVVDAVPIGLPIRDVALSPHGDTAYVLSCGPGFGAVVDVVDTSTNVVTATGKIAEVSGPVTQLPLSGDSERAYLVGEQSVAVVSTQTHNVIGTIAVAGQPSCVSESPDGKHLYIADYAGTVSVLTIAAPPEWARPELAQLEPAMT